MRLVKPSDAAKEAQRVKEEPTRKQGNREVWEDYQSPRSKTEFERGPSNRMVPKRRQGFIQEEENQPVITNNYRTDYESIESALGYRFKDQTILVRALTHRSALGPRERSHYERLEFLGDAVLDLGVAHLLSDLYPEAREGELSKMRAALVNTQALAQIAQDLNVSPFIKLGRGEHSSGGANRPSILADVVEAVIGAVYRDGSYEIALELIRRIFGPTIEKVNPHDPKTELQEALHAAGSSAPEYLLELVEGPEHAPNFVTVVMVDGEIAGRGKGPTKKASQQAAANQALESLKSDVPVVTSVAEQEELVEQVLLQAEVKTNHK